MNNQLIDLYVITIDEQDVYGNYTEDELKDAMKDLFLSLKGDIENHYTIEEQLDYHYDGLMYLYKMIKKEDIKHSDLKEFLSLYNELTPNVYSVETIEIDSSDEALAIRFICTYGLENYRNNFHYFELHFYHDYKIDYVKSLSIIGLKEYIYSFIYQEISELMQNCNGIDIISNKFNYLTNLKNRYCDLEKGINELIVLEDLIENFNFEYQQTGKAIKISKK
ncbi:hypothetical protein KND94_001952 [Staphylococcus pseudintermedius]|uniref:hypothetical protein n=1 Tax=Staphylococcus pseudintermedius TaxID=283734 RepID=UPI0019E2FB3B|nr:hypothetical protein [Staphylococcus pseudintermedius]EGQ3391995.1 hypothetical protein [Staphylococcus pseudintermedius]EGQ4238827.1 hypothetical protein [Staphylococcus pseudintermedius]EHP0490862.1 hypothetical protein [Staphylococcus pseudintermedius]EIA5751626.1 hypothetical protein [Staphylococcus pseudintermedius]WMZ54927.1 hypothetical protein QS425_11735 [Staphylococcus pseudintermedius]